MKINKKQIQKEICNAMLDGTNRITYAEIENNAIVVTMNGRVAYVLQKSECIFDISKIPTGGNSAKLAEVFEPNENDTLLTLTPLTIDIITFGIGKTIRQLTCENFDCFVDTQLLKHFMGCKFYGYGRLDRILIKDDFDCPIAVVMPIRYEPKS